MTGKKEKETPKTIVVTDISIEKAIRKALATLNAKEQEVTIKVLKEENKGLFGMEGSKLAKIRVTLNPPKNSNTLPC